MTAIFPPNVNPFLDPPKSRRTVRRLSSRTVTNDDLAADGPMVIGPDSHLDRPSNALETAASMELAKRHLGLVSSGPSTPLAGSGTSTPNLESTPSLVTDQYAFAFDIDGVLIRGGDPIPEAIEAMRVLNGENEYGIKIPYIFVTNGGGKTEASRCLQLSQQLSLEISPGQFICGHTPMREMASKYTTVLVVGGEGDQCRHVAEGYGFKDVVTPGDIIKDNSHTTPFRKLTSDELDHSRARNFGEVDIDAIFVFADSRDWAGDQQIILDLLMSVNGRLGTRSTTFDEGPPIFFSHNDIVWSAGHEYVRLGMGALRSSIEHMFQLITGKQLHTTAFGKPQLETFEYATRLLQQWRKETHGINQPPETVYFVGDTPGSDIRGTNEYNDSKGCSNEWFSILVETGVYEKGTKPEFQPNTVVRDVLEAVRFGMRREFGKALEKAGRDGRKPSMPDVIRKLDSNTGSAIAV